MSFCLHSFNEPLINIVISRTGLKSGWQIKETVWVERGSISRQTDVTKREKRSHYENRMKWSPASRMVPLTWQDNICFHWAPRLSLQTKLCFIKELIFPPQWCSRWKEVLYIRNQNRKLLKFGVTLVMALSLSSYNLVKTKTASHWGKASICLLEKSHCTFAPLQLSHPIPKWKDGIKHADCVEWEGKTVQTPVNIKCATNSSALFWFHEVSLPPHILISRHTKPEVVQGWGNTTWRQSLSCVAVLA